MEKSSFDHVTDNSYSFFGVLEMQDIFSLSHQIFFFFFFFFMVLAGSKEPTPVKSLCIIGSSEYPLPSLNESLRQYVHLNCLGGWV